MLRTGCAVVLALMTGVAAATDAASAATVGVKASAGFVIERVYQVPRDTAGSWIALTADRRGALYAADQYGPVHRVVLPAAAEDRVQVDRAPFALGGVHGFAWVNNDLYAVAGQKAISPPGLYRLRDTDADGAPDEVTLLRALDGDGEHGPHAVAPAPDGRSLYVMAGNATRLPDLVRSRAPRVWGEDALLPPLPAVVGSETRGYLGGGWIARTDLEGSEWELVSVGLRNAYDFAVDERGEVFTFDSDTELEINLPWYRPTRVLHAVSGADFGWRRGVFKVPESAPDGWPAVLPLGLGSPTAVLFPSEAQLPTRYRRALWVADWSYGKLYAVHLRAKGATFTGHAEVIVAGTPLPITALCVNPADGALYFTTGGRRTRSALYRLRWTGDLQLDPPASTEPESTSVAERRALEQFHGRADSPAVAQAWPALASADPIVRRAARTALESQPVDRWRDRALRENEPRASLAALLALARIEGKEKRGEIHVALRRTFSKADSPELRGEALRVLALTIARGGEPTAAQREAWLPTLHDLLPGEETPLLIELLVYLQSPEAMKRGFAALERALTREAQLDIARSLRARPPEWSPAQRRNYFDWLGGTAGWRGGASFNLFLKNLREEALALATEAERIILEAALAGRAASIAPLPSHGEVRSWTVDELVTAVANDRGARDLTRGRRAFAAAGCYACHAFAGEGGALGPDLTGSSARLSTQDLIEAIVDPSREISDQYGTVTVRLRNGRKHSGRIVNVTEEGPHLAEDLSDPSRLLRLKDVDIATIEQSTVSLMPSGLLNSLRVDEVLDLLALLRSGLTRPE